MKNWLKALAAGFGSVTLVLLGITTRIDPGFLLVLPLDSDADGMTAEFWTLVVVALCLLSCATWLFKKRFDEKSGVPA